MKKPAHFKFRLYIAGASPNSRQALANLKVLCAEFLTDRHEIEVVDILIDSARALLDGVMLTPTLVKLSPLPTQTITGTLSPREAIIQAFGLVT